MSLDGRRGIESCGKEGGGWDLLLFRKAGDRDVFSAEIVRVALWLCQHCSFLALLGFGSW